MTKPYTVGRFLTPGCPGRFIRRIALTHKVTIRQISVRMQVTMKRVREVFDMEHVAYFTACEYLEGITGNTKLISPVVLNQVRKTEGKTWLTTGHN